MQSAELHEENDDNNMQLHSQSLTNSEKIRLINSNMTHLKNLVMLSIKICGVRLVFFCIIIRYVDEFITVSSDRKDQASDSWNLIFYILTSMMDFLTILNDVQMLKLIKKENVRLDRIKTDLANNVNNSLQTGLGSYRNYLSIYDVIKVYKYQPRRSSSINETIRYLHLIITFYSFGNLALNIQGKVQTSMFKMFVLWIFILSIYFSAFEIDFVTFEGSSGTYVDQQAKIHPSDIAIDDIQRQSESEKHIKHLYLKYCRRPFQILYVISIIFILSSIILFFDNSLLNLMLIICIVAHMTELIYEKYLQNRLISLNLGQLDFSYLTPYRLLSEITKDHKKTHLFITSFVRYSIILSILAFFRNVGTTILQSFLLFFINILLFYGQYMKFMRLHNSKLYILEPSILQVTDEKDIECSICLMGCSKKDQILKLPCFSNHIFHFKCMKNWFHERKQCPLCRYSLQIYDIR